MPPQCVTHLLQPLQTENVCPTRIALHPCSFTYTIERRADAEYQTITSWLCLCFSCPTVSPRVRPCTRTALGSCRSTCGSSPSSSESCGCCMSAVWRWPRTCRRGPQRLGTSTISYLLQILNMSQVSAPQLITFTDYRLTYVVSLASAVRWGRAGVRQSGAVQPCSCPGENRGPKGTFLICLHHD